MPGSTLTSGLSWKRSSSRASGITVVFGSRIAWGQKPVSSGSSELPIPTVDLNHWRSESTSVNEDIEVPKTRWASRVMRSKRSSGSVSSRFSACSAPMRRSSSAGFGASITYLILGAGSAVQDRGRSLSTFPHAPTPAL
jgi:hypothetical protein